jgi:hypothetical protein
MPCELHLPIGDGPAPGERDAAVLQAAADAIGGPVAGVHIERRSTDLRKRREPKWVLRCRVFPPGEPRPERQLPPLLRKQTLARPATQTPIVVGMGPAGLFAAIAFAEAGVRCVVVDRGAAVEERNLHVRDLRTKGELHAESNLCFGEGGAGTYSDGKLYTRSKHPLVRDVLERLVALGGDPDLLVAAHPHAGTNRLIPMMKPLRAGLCEAGHDLRFGRRMDDLLIRDGRVVGVRLDDGAELLGPVILATGHSARDTYRMLYERGIALQRKDFAIGARVEHPQALVDAVQQGPLAGHPALGPAEYFLQQQVGSRGVYSFCMCPGGFVLPSPTQLGRLNVNGMSNSNRGSGFANAALVAQLPAAEFPDDPDWPGPLAGVGLQERLEIACFQAGGGGYVAPAQRLVDFVRGVDSRDLPERFTYRPGLVPGRIDRLLPARIVYAMQQGARQVDRQQLRGYLSREALIVGVETTTSSPVRIPRGEDRQSVSHPGLYPCAEGAGYAGGIVSSAIEGFEAAQAVLAGF